MFVRKKKTATSKNRKARLKFIIAPKFLNIIYYLLKP